MSPIKPNLTLWWCSDRKEMPHVQNGCFAFKTCFFDVVFPKAFCSLKHGFTDAKEFANRQTKFFLVTVNYVQKVVCKKIPK